MAAGYHDAASSESSCYRDAAISLQQRMLSRRSLVRADCGVDDREYEPNDAQSQASDRHSMTG